MRRRDLILGVGCVAAVGAAETLRPRKLLTLAGGRELARIIPSRFAGWSAEESGDLVAPETGTLAATLYNETVGRIYRPANDGAAVMLLAAHGDSQSDLLQLHRPEACYQAVGFSIVDRRFEPLPLAPGVAVPAVALAARSGTRVEDVLYWTRLGEYLPLTAGEQRQDRLRTAMSGYVADGVLVRASMVRDGDAGNLPLLARFMAEMVRAVAPDARVALVGTARAKALAALPA